MDAKNLIGSTLDGRYEVTRVIGAGGMGAVYEANHTGTGRKVAVKVISTGDVSRDAGLVGRFQREAKAAGAIATQHICQVLDTGTDATTGWPYMAMEFMEGEDVQQLVRRIGVVSGDLAMRIIAQACVGLSKAHGAGVVHRDIKPANLFLAKGDDGRIIVKLLDFGIAKVKMEHASEMGDGGLTRTGTMLGSPLYMSPEQARGMKTIDHRADIWSLGVVLYELLCGRTPYHHIEALGELIIAICSEPPQPVQEFGSWISPEAATIVHKALRASANDRYQTAADMLDAVKQVLPNGFDIHESQMISLSETQRREVARRISVTPPPPIDRPSTTAMAAAAHSVPPPGMTQINTGTTEGVAAPTDRSPPRQQKSSMPLILAGAAISVLGGGFAAYKFASPGDSSDSTTPTAVVATTAPTAVQQPTVAPAAQSNPPAIEPAAKEKTVPLVIIPKDAIVMVDDKPAEVSQDGVVKIKGGLGSEHSVKLTIGTASITQDVTIGEGGANPPLIELEVKGGKLQIIKQKGSPSGSPTGPAIPTATGTKPGIEQEFGD